MTSEPVKNWNTLATAASAAGGRILHRLPGLAALLILLPLVTAVPAHAGPMDPHDVPEALRPWIPWVLHGEAEKFCPSAHDDAAHRLCTWPSQLALDLDAGGGRFELRVSLDAPGWVALPGDGPRWPQDVSMDQRAAPVLDHEGFPALWLARGSHRVQGRFAWSALPESLRVPPANGLVDLRLSGRAVTHPQRDEQHQLWLGRRAVATDREPERLGLRVFRLIDDDIPLQVTTRIEIDAGGEVREETLGPALPAGLVPLSLQGELPARLDDDGRLHVQLRPGTWVLTLVARSTAPLDALAAVPKAVEHWPAQEVWSLLAHPELRVTEAGGMPAVDPTQTGVPGDWQNLPAFLAEPGTQLALKEIRRGVTDRPPDQLHLSRQLWLDFDGGGFAVQDQLQGALSRSARLEAQAPIRLGQVQIDGQPRLITTHEGRTGVEVRNTRLALSADSRIEGGQRRIPARGWNADVQGVDARLYLPPAWRLLAAPGTDNVPDTWLSRWSLLDLFLVLIATIAALRLFGHATAGLTLLALALTWHEPGAPQWTWLNLVAAIALLRALPAGLQAGRLRKLLLGYQWVAAAVLACIALPFAIQQARLSLYPQLEDLGGHPDTAFAGAAAPAPIEAQVVMVEPSADASAMRDDQAIPENLGKRSTPRRKLYSASPPPAPPPAQEAVQRLDPKVLTQTGPGLPDWHWREVQLSWSGPVTAGQTFDLWLMPPVFTRLLGWVSIALIALLAARWLGVGPRLRRLGGGARTAGVVLVSVAVGTALTTPAPAQAQEVTEAGSPSSPGSRLLDELRARLTAAPDCQPGCASWSRLDLSIDGQRLLLRLTAEAQVDAALPLPVPPLAGGQNRVWQPQQVLLEQGAAQLVRDDGGVLWLRVPAGRSTVLLSGDLSGFQQLQLPLNPAPKQVRVAAPGWLVSGVDAQGSAGNALNLVREQKDAAAAPEGAAQTFPPLLRLTRTLQLGSAWRAESSLERLGSAEGAFVATLAALPGEVVTGDSVRRAGAQIQASFAPGQTRLDWSSSLDTQPRIELKASASAGLIEVWRFDVGPLWHAAFSGLPPVQTQDGEWQLHSFQPWPGESLAVAITQPAAVKGQVLTLDGAALAAQPGQRATDYTLDLQLRASQGGQHALPLPASLELLALNIDGQPQPARREGERLILPLHPGAQRVQLNLRAEDGMGVITRTPALAPGLPGVNARVSIQLPQDRWVLLAGGPALGPAVLFWGVLAVLLLLAVALGRSGFTPLKSVQWALLMIGLSQLPIFGAAVVAGWLFALALRGRMPAGWSAARFNLAQVLLALWTLAALGTLFGAVAQGLLGTPDMQIAGNGSSAALLRWYQDRFAAQLPSAWVMSVSIWFYRGLMLLWALWLANSLLNWLRWGWSQYSSGGLWKKKAPAPKPSALQPDLPATQTPGGTTP
ncbi:MAG: hypothetical protein ACT4P0_01015 [Panacagrimonas sp.]